MYYKQMMGFANVDTEAAILLTRQQLSTLDVKMIELISLNFQDSTPRSGASLEVSPIWHHVGRYTDQPTY